MTWWWYVVLACAASVFYLATAAAIWPRARAGFPLWALLIVLFLPPIFPFFLIYVLFAVAATSEVPTAKSSTVLHRHSTVVIVEEPKIRTSSSKVSFSSSKV